MKKNNNKKGSSVVMLLFFIAIAMTITASAVVLSVINTQSIYDLQGSTTALQVAESGAEEALLRLIRNPQYRGGSIDVGGGAARISVSGSDSKTIISYGQYDNFARTVQVQTSYTDNILIVDLWREKF